MSIDLEKTAEVDRAVEQGTEKRPSQVEKEASTPEFGRKPSTSSNNGISLKDVTPINLIVNNVSVNLRQQSSAATWNRLHLGKKFVKGDLESATLETRPILTHISTQFRSGSLTAIIGSSGSGKTSL